MNMNKSILWSGLTIIIVGLVAYSFVNSSVAPQASESPQATPVASSIMVAEPPYDFGDIDIFGGKVSTTYTLKNEGVENVTIVSAVTSCMCTEGVIDDLRFGMHETTGNEITIPAGGEKILTAIYDPLAHGPDGTGAVTRELFLKTNSTATPDIRVRFSANVVKNKVN